MTPPSLPYWGSMPVLERMLRLTMVDCSTFLRRQRRAEVGPAGLESAAYRLWGQATSGLGLAQRA
jgi:hypothetical protein